MSRKNFRKKQKESGDFRENKQIWTILAKIVAKMNEIFAKTEVRKKINIFRFNPFFHPNKVTIPPQFSMAQKIQRSMNSVNIEKRG